MQYRYDVLQPFGAFSLGGPLADPDAETLQISSVASKTSLATAEDSKLEREV